MQKLTFIWILLFSVVILQLHSQNAPVTKAPILTCDPGNILDIPITVDDFNNIGALSLTFQFDPTVLTYQSYTNNSGFPGLLIFQPVAGKINAGAYVPSGSPISLPDNSVLFTLTFYCTGGATALQWFDNGGSCEYADEFYNPLNDSPTCSYYTNGSVNFSTINLDLKAYLEGPYLNGEMSTTLRDLDLVPTAQPYSASPWNYGCPESVAAVPPNVVDWVLVELRESSGGPALATDDTKVAEQVGFLMVDGTIKKSDGVQNLEFSVPSTNDLYIVIYHRNHISILSSAPIAISSGAGTYDFTIAEMSAWGGSSAHKELAPGVWGMAAGDSNGDGNIDALDKAINLDPLMGKQGYLFADFSFDAQLDNQDKNEFWYVNLGFTSEVP